MNTKRVLLLCAARKYSESGEGRQIRRHAGLSLQEVAEPVGVVITTISRWETGQRRPRGDAAVRWAELLADIERVKVAAA